MEVEGQGLSSLVSEEEEMIDSLFYRCDTLGEGRVHVYNVIQFLKNCLSNGNSEPDLLELSTILESYCMDGKINLSCYRQAVKQWVTRIRNRCESTSFLEPDGPLNTSYNLCNSSTERSLETSGIGNVSFHKTEHDIGELLQELEDLKFQNRKLNEEQVQLRGQINTEEEVATNLNTELQNRNKNEDQLRKKIKSLQDLLDLRQSVMDENEELKMKLFSSQELKRDLDTKVLNLERENGDLQTQVKTYEQKWQKTCSDLDVARSELKQLQTTHFEQKDLLISAQESKASQEEALTKKDEEVASLKERLNRLMEQNEKLQEEKEDVQERLIQTDCKLQRYQTKVEQLGLSDDSLYGGENGMEKSKIVPRLMFSTPLPKNSICMELKDRLNEDRSLPSPLCEKSELSKDVNFLNRKSTFLPTYMSVWDYEDYDVSNNSLQDYSLELLKHRKSLGPADFCDTELQEKLESLKNLEKDGLQKEIIKLYRANLELSEKCHKSELKETELREVVNDTTHRSELERQRFLSIEESLKSSREARELDLKDLWRLVHSLDEPDTSESECSLSTSTEQLKEQIKQDIEELKKKLNKKSQSVLGAERSRVFHVLKKRASNSPLVEALNIDSVKITKKPHIENENCLCRLENGVNKQNKSVPIIRKHSTFVNDSEEDGGSVYEDLIGDHNRVDSEHSEFETEVDTTADTVDSKEDSDKMQRRDIPMRFKSGALLGFENGLSEISNSEKCSVEVLGNSVKNRGFETLEKSKEESTDINGKDFGDFLDNEQKCDAGIDFRKPGVSKQYQVHRDRGHAMLRRQSYKKAIENRPSARTNESNVIDKVDDFPSAIEHGHTSPTSSYGTASFSVSDTTPEDHTADSAILTVAPKFSSTPLPVGSTKLELKNLRNDKSVKWKDFENLTEVCHAEEGSEIVIEKENSVQTELFKTDSIPTSRLSPCNSAALSILLEEETNNNTDSLCTHSIDSRSPEPSPHLSNIKHSRESEETEAKELNRSGVSDYDFSAEIWTLSGTSDSNPCTQASKDSGHSSSVTSFEKANAIAVNGEQTSPVSSNCSVTSGSSPSSSTSDSKPLSLSPIPSVDHTSSQSPSTDISNTDVNQIPSTSDSNNVLLSNDESTNDKPFSNQSSNDSLCVARSNDSNDILNKDCKAKEELVNKGISNELQCVGKADNDVNVFKFDTLESVDKETGGIKVEHANIEQPKVKHEQPKVKLKKSVSFELTSTESATAKSVKVAFPSFKGSDNYQKGNNVLRVEPNFKGHYSSLSYQNERNLAPSERILQRLVANKLSPENSPEIKQIDANLIHLTHRIAVEPESVEYTDTESTKSDIDTLKSSNKKGLPMLDSELTETVDGSAALSSNNKKRLTVDIGGSVMDKVDTDLSDNSEPPSPAICFFKVENGLKKPHIDQNKNPVVNGHGTSFKGCQVLVPEERSDHAVGDGPRSAFASNLSKIRENHLAKRRDYIKQNKMPQLSELSEKETQENNNEEKKPTPAVTTTKESKSDNVETNGDIVMPSIPDEFLQKLDLTSTTGRSSEELSDQEVESKFTSLSLAFKTDAQTLEKRLEIQERSRDIAEQNVDKELLGLRSCLETLNQICSDPQVREVLSKIQNHVDILEKSTARVSSRAEVFGAIQQEKRMSKAVDIMVHHVENIRRVHEREHAELEEARKLLQDSRSLAPSTIDLPGGDMRRSASVCQNNMFGVKMSPQGAPTSNPLTPSAAKAIKLLKASRRRVSEIALPKVLGGTGAATLHPSASMGNMNTAHIDSDSNSLRPYNEADARSRFQAVIASTTVKSAVANTLRRASLEKQNHVQSVSPAVTPQVSRNNSSDSANKLSESQQDKEKQKNLEEEAFKKGYEQGMRASLGQDLSSLREQQNHINESLGEIMDSIDNQTEEPKSLKEMLMEQYKEMVPKIKISGWRIRMTFGCFFIVMAILSVIISLCPVNSATLVGYRHYGRPAV